MSRRKIRPFPRISRVFATKAQRLPISLKKAFEKSHRVPKVRSNFTKAVVDRLKQTFSKPSLMLTPIGARAVRGAARRSVAQKNIDIRKLPDTRPFRERPVRKQFERSAGNRIKASKGRSS